jgi:hypothetical protein
MSTSHRENQQASLSAAIACALTGEDLGRQASRWSKLRAGAGLDRIETADGLRLTFSEGESVEAELRALIAVENACCSWARWEISRADGTLVMDARSAGDGVAALHGMFVSDESAPPSGNDDC